MKMIDLDAILKGDISRIDNVNVRDIALYEDNVVVYPVYVKNMLKKYLSGNITSDELSEWAAFLCLRTEYSCLHWEDDEVADYYEDMWYVIQKLSTPEIDGEINEERVKQYLSELEKYSEE